MSTDSHTIGKYKLVNCIATGQSTQIWEVLDTETTRRAAMKLLLPEQMSDPEKVGALKSEFKVASSFDHPNILKYEELLTNKKNAYFTMELFNAPNHPQFGLPASTIGVGGVATITSTQRANRQMQFALRLGF